MTEVTFRRFDAAEFLGTEEAIAGFLEDSADSGDATVMLNALAAVARARNMSSLADSVGISRSGLYKALSNAGNPSFDLVDKIAKTMGYRVSLVKMNSSAAPNPTEDAKQSTRTLSRGSIKTAVKTLAANKRRSAFTGFGRKKAAKKQALRPVRLAGRAKTA